MKMKNYIRSIVWVLMLAVFLLVGFAMAQELNAAADFKLPDINNETVTLSSYRDKQPVWLFFWTTWCPFCREGLKLLSDKYPQLVKDGFELLAINVGETNYKVDNFIKRYSLTFKVLLDKDARVAYLYDILGVPTYVLVDKKGHIAFAGNRFPRENYKDLISE